MFFHGWGRRVACVPILARCRRPWTSKNPFTDDEAARYNRYVQMARNGEVFQPWQVQDFNTLIQKFKTEHPSDPNLSGLLLLGAFLVGLYLLNKQQNGR